MGNSSSTTLVVKTEEDEYYAGDIVKGNVYLCETKGISADSLHVSVHGFEDSNIHYTTEEHRGRGPVVVHHHNERESRLLMKVGSTLDSYTGGLLSPGQYEYPFRAKLPQGLPSTTYASMGSSYCEVAYQIEASLKNKRGKIVKSVYTIKVAALPRPLNHLQGSVICPPDEITLNYCCFNTKGKITIAAELDCGIVTRGEEVKVGFAARNESKADLSGVEVELKEVVNWRAKHRKEDVKRTIFKEKVSSSDLRDSVIGMNKILMAPLQQVTGMVPDTVRDTYSGKLMNTKHTLYIRAKTSTFYSNPELSLVVYVQQPGKGRTDVTRLSTNQVNPFRKTKLEVEEIPPNWSPRISKEVEIPTAYVVGSTRRLEASPDTNLPPSTTIKKISDQIDYAFDPTSLIEEISHNPGYARVLKGINPMQYADLVSKVKSVFDQPAVAKKLAEIMAEQFTCDHVAALCRHPNIPPMYRTNIVIASAPLARDFDTNKGYILQELEGYERKQVELKLNIEYS